MLLLRALDLWAYYIGHFRRHQCTTKASGGGNSTKPNKQKRRLLLTCYFSVGWLWRASGLYEGWSYVSNWNHQLGDRLWPQRHTWRLYKCESLSWLDSRQHETLRKKNELSTILWQCPCSFLLGTLRMLTGLPVCPDAYDFQYKRKTKLQCVGRAHSQITLLITGYWKLTLLSPHIPKLSPCIKSHEYN